MDTSFLRRVYLTGFAVLACALFYYQVIKGDYFLDRAKNNYVRVVPQPALRGVIYDRNGEKIAFDKASFNIAVIPYQIRKKSGELFAKLSSATGIPEPTIKHNYTRNLVSMFSPVDIILNIDKAAAFDLQEKFKNDVLIDPQPRRYYPYPEECCHILGYLGYIEDAASFPKAAPGPRQLMFDDEPEITSQYTDLFYANMKKYGYASSQVVGVSGIEQFYNPYLTGEDGGDLIEVDASGRAVGFVGERKSQKGKNIYLTIDANIQKIAYRMLKEKGVKGALILMSSQTGEIIALVSYPAYNPNYFIENNNQEKAKILLNSTRPLLNRAVQSAYPLGSTFKPVLALAALEEGKINPSTTFTCPGHFNLGSARWRCWSTHGPQDLYQAIAHSCNVYFYNTGLIVGAELLSKWGKIFGLESLTGIDLPYEKRGTVPSPAWKAQKLKLSWYKGDTVNFSIGQGFLISTPISLITAINVFATNGYLVKPYVLKRVGDTQSANVTRTALNISQEKLNVVKKGMVMVVNAQDGTAKNLATLGLNIAGKTGTAQNPPNKPHGWFTGFFPYDNPKYTICVFLENAGSSYESLKLGRAFLDEVKQKNLLKLD